MICQKPSFCAISTIFYQLDCVLHQLTVHLCLYSSLKSSLLSLSFYLLDLFPFSCADRPDAELTANAEDRVEGNSSVSLQRLLLCFNFYNWLNMCLCDKVIYESWHNNDREVSPLLLLEHNFRHLISFQLFESFGRNSPSWLHNVRPFFFGKRVKPNYNALFYTSSQSD